MVVDPDSGGCFDGPYGIDPEDGNRNRIIAGGTPYRENFGGNCYDLIRSAEVGTVKGTGNAVALGDYISPLGNAANQSKLSR